MRKHAAVFYLLLSTFAFSAQEPLYINTKDGKIVPPSNTTHTIDATTPGLNLVGLTFLAEERARVIPPPIGNDTTGTIGDLDRPYATVQAVIGDAEVLGTTNLVIDVGNNSFHENLTTNLAKITFVGAGEDLSNAFDSLTHTGTGSAYIVLIDTGYPAISTSTLTDLEVAVERSYLGNLTNSHTGGGINLWSESGTGWLIGNVTANTSVFAYNLEIDGTISSTTGDAIELRYLRRFYDNPPTGPAINSASSNVAAIGTQLGNVTCANLTLYDSATRGTLTVSGTFSYTGIGQYASAQRASGSAISLTTDTVADVTSITSLPAGDWDVTGMVDYVLSGATTTGFRFGSSTTSATLGGQDTFAEKPLGFTTLTSTYADVLPTVRYSLTAPTTIYLVARATFSAGTMTAYGTLRARRANP